MRRSIDPLSNATPAIERNVLFIPVTDLPSGIAMAAGMKTPKTRWDVYRDVQASLLDKNCTPGTFHLKNVAKSATTPMRSAAAVRTGVRCTRKSRSSI
jgi:hypothetical protein